MGLMSPLMGLGVKINKKFIQKLLELKLTKRDEI
jgi:hypothetical protein